MFYGSNFILVIKIRSSCKIKNVILCLRSNLLGCVNVIGFYHCSIIKIIHNNSTNNKIYEHFNRFDPVATSAVKLLEKEPRLYIGCKSDEFWTSLERNLSKYTHSSTSSFQNMINQVKEESNFYTS